MRVAVASDAGTYPTRTEPRYAPNGRYLGTVEKGGWIRLMWENLKTGDLDERTIQVTRVRALQAMSALARGEGVV